MIKTRFSFSMLHLLFYLCLMIVRIVKMRFTEGKEGEFLEIFKEIEKGISSFPGCLNLQLLQDKNNPHLFFTYSTWENEGALENYRSSDFFAGTWKRTKVLFSQKAEAWTLESKGNGKV